MGRDIEAKPCPFCGSESLEFLTFSKYLSPNSYMAIECKSCGAIGPDSDSEDGSVEVWNDRVFE